MNTNLKEFSTGCIHQSLGIIVDQIPNNLTSFKIRNCSVVDPVLTFIRSKIWFRQGLRKIEIVGCRFDHGDLDRFLARIAAGFYVHCNKASVSSKYGILFQIKTRYPEFTVLDTYIPKK